MPSYHRRDRAWPLLPEQYVDWDSEKDLIVPVKNTAEGWNRGIKRSLEVWDTGQYSGSTSFSIGGNSEDISNNVVVDKRTGLMWTRYIPVDLGSAGTGRFYYSDRLAAKIRFDITSGTLNDGDVVYNSSESWSFVLVNEDLHDDNDSWYVNWMYGSPAATDSFTDADSGATGTLLTVTSRGSKDDVWEYMFQARKNALAGHRDWRVPNVQEHSSLHQWDFEFVRTTTAPETSLFPQDFQTIAFWSCTSNALTYPTYKEAYVNASYFSGSAANVHGYIATPNRHKWRLNTEIMGMLVRGPISGKWPCRVHKTHQTHQYEGLPDDGFFECGEDNSLYVRNTGQYSGSTTLSIFETDDEVMLNKTIVDASTGLMWLADCSWECGPFANGAVPAIDRFTVQKDMWMILNAVNDGEVGGHDDWRIPNVHEAMSIYVSLRGDDHNLLVSDLFEHAEVWFWTSTHTVDSWVCMVQSHKGWYGAVETSSYRVRFVRGGHKEEDLR